MININTYIDLNCKLGKLINVVRFDSLYNMTEILFMGKLADHKVHLCFLIMEMGPYEFYEYVIVKSVACLVSLFFKYAVFARDACMHKIITK